MYYLYCLAHKMLILFAASVSATENVRKVLYGWTESSLALEILVLDLSWLNCGPERWVSALTEREFSPGKAHNHRGPISVAEKDLTSSLSGWTERGACESFFSSDWSSAVRTGPLTPDESTAPGHPRCETHTAMYSAWKAGILFTPEGRHCGPPFCFQAFSILGILLWILKVCKCVHVKDSKSTRCYRPASKKSFVSEPTNIRQVGKSSQVQGWCGMIKRYSEKINTWLNQLYLTIFWGKKGVWVRAPARITSEWNGRQTNDTQSVPPASPLLLLIRGQS